MVRLRRFADGASVSGRASQHGQALIYGLFMIVASVAAMFFLFNAGQLSSEKTKLVNTADAVAYSAGVMDARTLNFMAYTNRAMLANTVAIAQLVSLSSWASYLKQLGDSPHLEEWKSEFYGAYPAWLAAESMGDEVYDALNDSGVLENLAEKSDTTFIKKYLVKAQGLAYSGLAGARVKVMKEVADANYRDDGAVEATLLPSTGTTFYGLVSEYSGENRTRFAEVAKVSAKLDGFLKRRTWMMVGNIESECYGLPNWIDRRGGTELIGFDEWKALDALSKKKWVVYWGVCGVVEIPGGWGSTKAGDDSASERPEYYDWAKMVNFISSMAAESSSAEWDYSGLPKFYALDKDYLKDDKPERELVLRSAFGLKRKISQTRTSEGVSQIRNSGADNRLAKSLNRYEAKPADNNELVAVSAVEVYFDRGSDNPYGKKEFNKPREIANLFNPFWHVHLVSPKIEERMAAQGSDKVLP